MLDTLVQAFVTLFVVIDPVGMAPLFVALTQGMTADHRNRVGLQQGRQRRRGNAEQCDDERPVVAERRGLHGLEPLPGLRNTCAAGAEII